MLSYSVVRPRHQTPAGDGLDAGIAVAAAAAGRRRGEAVSYETCKSATHADAGHAFDGNAKSGDEDSGANTADE